MQHNLNLLQILTKNQPEKVKQLHFRQEIALLIFYVVVLANLLRLKVRKSGQLREQVHAQVSVKQEA